MVTKLESSDLMLLVTICGAVTVPLRSSPVGVNTAMSSVPPTLTVMLPLATGILIFDVPLEILFATIPVRLAPLPKK
jgi:hypothetical protein